MFVLRVAAVLSLLSIGGALILYLLSGEPRYKAWAGRFARIGAVVVVVFLLLLFIERLLAPMV
jgi:succinate dehydrogenase hydrophobic anchor subunit